MTKLLKRALAIYVLFVFGLFATPYLLKVRARHSVDTAYSLLSAKGAAKDLDTVIAPRAIKQLKAIESKYGRVVSHEIVYAQTQVLGTPWGADVAVSRERGKSVERVGGDWKRIEVVQLIEPVSGD